MIRRVGRLVAVVVALTVPGVAGRAGAQQLTPAEPPTVLLLMDTSGSMAEDDGTGLVKIEGARSAALNFIAQVEPEARIGLRTYPAGSGSCDTGRERIPIGQRNADAMSAVVRTLTAGGDTPTGEALEAAANALRASGAKRGTIVLISDGEHTCERDPCQVADEIVASGLDIEVNTVGFKISARTAQQELECIANATGGSYVNADDSAGLQNVLDDLSRPTLDLSLEYPSSVVADVGTSADGLVTVKAHITNRHRVEARNVKARLRFDVGASPGLVSPVKYLGNVAAVGSADTSWSFRPGLVLIGKTLRFTVIVSAGNARDDIVQSGSISVRDGGSLADAGPLLRDAKRVAILGDSYSSGEGSGEYTPETDVRGNYCHRSAKTYLLPILQLGAEYNLACSGALTTHLTAPNEPNGRRAQVVDLRDLQGRVGPLDAAFLTMGGNDVGFGTIARECLFPFRACSERIDGTPSETYISERLEPLASALLGGYAAVDKVLNAADVVAKRGRRAPVVVLAYPRILPGADRACLSLATIGQDELAFLSRMVDRLNDTVRAAVEAARKIGIPSYFVDVEDAFLPDHTVCDRTSYARGLDTFQGLRRLAQPPTNLGQILAFLARRTAPAAAIQVYRAVRALGRDLQELFHPNVLGYQAMTRGLVRWSQTPAGAQAARVDERKARALDPGPIIDGKPAPLPGDGSREVRTGGYYAVEADGFLPGSEVRLEIASAIRALQVARADGTGRVRTAVGIPAGVDAGRHEIVVRGVDPQGQPRTVTVAVDVGDGGRSRVPFLFFAGIALAASSGGVLRRARRDDRVRPSRGDRDATTAGSRATSPIVGTVRAVDRGAT